MSVSQIPQAGAAAQAQVVLMYANQLEDMPVVGRQTINLTNKTENQITLEDGDTIYIPNRPSHVSVTGSVQNPTTALYLPAKSVENYIQDAGGYTRISDIRNLYLMLPNGQSVPFDQLNQQGQIIPPGSVIVVPPKTDKLSWLGITEVFSKVLANIATSILAINAVTD